MALYSTLCLLCVISLFIISIHLPYLNQHWLKISRGLLLLAKILTLSYLITRWNFKIKMTQSNIIILIVQLAAYSSSVFWIIWCNNNFVFFHFVYGDFLGAFFFLKHYYIHVYMYMHANVKHHYWVSFHQL